MLMLLAEESLFVKIVEFISASQSINCIWSSGTGSYEAIKNTRPKPLYVHVSLLNVFFVDNEKITAIYCLWMAGNKRGSE